MHSVARMRSSERQSRIAERQLQKKLKSAFDGWRRSVPESALVAAARGSTTMIHNIGTMLAERLAPLTKPIAESYVRGAKDGRAETLQWQKRGSRHR